MKHFSLLALLLAATGCATCSMNAPQPGVVSSNKLEWTLSRSGETRYLEYVPKNYGTEPSKRWPLMLFLHGAGERGTNIEKVAVHGPMKHVRAGREFPLIIVAPQCPDGECWNNETLLKLLDHVIQKFRVDEDRIYLVGLSMGGYGTWKFAINHPERLAAAVPICGGGELIDLLALKTQQSQTALKSLPIRAFHGAKDPVVPLNESERTVGFLKRFGCTNVTLTVYPEALHDCWTQTFENPELYDWLLQQKR